VRKVASPRHTLARNMQPELIGFSTAEIIAHGLLTEPKSFCKPGSSRRPLPGSLFPEFDPLLVSSSIRGHFPASPSIIYGFRVKFLKLHFRKTGISSGIGTSPVKGFPQHTQRKSLTGCLFVGRLRTNQRPRWKPVARLQLELHERRVGNITSV
jgi:hypothetical protein